MGSKTFDFLTNSFLFDPDALADSFSGVAIQELKLEIARYRAFCIANYELLRSEINSEPDSVNILFDEAPGTAPLDRAALYADQCVLEDPLVAASRHIREKKDQLGAVIGAPEDPDRIRKQISKAALQMKANTPLVAGNFLKYFPTSLSFEGPDELPLLASQNGFEDVLPEKLLSRLKEAAEVTSLEMVGEGRFRVLPSHTPSRSIDINFDASAFGHRYGYVLFDTDFKILNEQKRLVRASMQVSSPPPAVEYYRHWVKQSVNQAAANFYWRGLGAAQLASSLNCIYSTQSQLLFEILPRTALEDAVISVKNADLFMNLDLSFLGGLSASELINLRVEEGAAFKNFRIALEGKLRSLHEETEPEKARRLAKEFLREMSFGQGNELRNRLKAFQVRFATNSAFMTASVLGSVQTHGLSLLGLIPSGKSLVDGFLDYQKDVKRHPAYFLWKLAKLRK